MPWYIYVKFAKSKLITLLLKGKALTASMHLIISLVKDRML